MRGGLGRLRRGSAGLVRGGVLEGAGLDRGRGGRVLTEGVGVVLGGAWCIVTVVHGGG